MMITVGIELMGSHNWLTGSLLLRPNSDGWMNV